MQDVVDRFGGGERSVLLDQSREVASVHELHYEEVDAVGLVGIVGGHDVGVAQLGRSFHFSLEPSDRRGILGDRRRQHLDRHHTLHAAMFGLKHLAHAAHPDPIEDGVVAEEERFRLAGQQRAEPETWSVGFAATNSRARSSAVLGWALGGTKFSSLPVQ